MTEYFALTDVRKRFGKTDALDGVTLNVSEPSIVGLVGKNGSGKTTLLRTIVGLYLPTSGHATTFGVPTVELGGPEFEKLGMSHQHDPLIPGMSGRRLMDYVANFHTHWDRDLERQLIGLLEVDESTAVGDMSPGAKQKLSLILAVCHHPSLLLLDEPISDLDPVVRRSVIEALLDRFRSKEMAIVMSSHLLHDVERIADRIVCMDRGRIVVDAALDDLAERYAEWTVQTAAGTLPDCFAESFVLAQRGDRFQTVLTVRDPAIHVERFRATYAADVTSRPLNLDRIFRVLVGAEEDGRGSDAHARVANSAAVAGRVSRS
jgi:ABC-2 type transport system ATP-binding protein